MPLPSALPKQTRSACTPKCSCAPPGARRKPVMTSSNTASAPWRWARSTICLEQARAPARACPPARSTTQATCSGQRSSAAASAAQVGERDRSRPASGRPPARPGGAWSSRCTSRASRGSRSTITRSRPVVGAREAHGGAGRVGARLGEAHPLGARARARRCRSATSSSSGCGSVKVIPLRSCSTIAASTAGWQCPRMIGPSAIGKSR